MKPLRFTALLISTLAFCYPAIAEDEATDNIDAADTANASTAEQSAENAAPQTLNTSEPLEDVPRYIRDYLYVPLRSGNSSSHRIVHKGLKSGTQVSLLQTDEESGYSLIRTSRGTEGWLRTQYLLENPTASIRLKQAENTIAQLSNEAGPMSERLINLENKNQQSISNIKQLERKNNTLTKELERIKSLSKNVVSLDDENKNLLADNELMRNERDSLKAENQRLEDQLKRDEFINGALAIILGMIATLAIQYFTGSKRRSDWA